MTTGKAHFDSLLNFDSKDNNSAAGTSEKKTKKAKEPSKVKVSVLKLPGAKLPEYKTSQAAGADVYASNNLPIWLVPGEIKLIPTGLRVKIPQGYEIQVRPRSGLAFKKGITVINSPGTVESDYADELGVILINHGQEKFEVKKGDRIAQIVLKRVETLEWDVMNNKEEFEALFEGLDREGGFGSTGV
jgi:dUTP pyrophosphatase